MIKADKLVQAAGFACHCGRLVDVDLQTPVGQHIACGFCQRVWILMGWSAVPVGGGAAYTVGIPRMGLDRPTAPVFAHKGVD